MPSHAAYPTSRLKTTTHLSTCGGPARAEVASKAPEESIAGQALGLFIAFQLATASKLSNIWQVNGL